jgi:hypothetical protein
MNCTVSYNVGTGLSQYPVATATYIGTNIARFWHDPTLKKALAEAINVSGTDKDIFDYCNFLFSHVDNVIRRRYGGVELQLESVTVTSGDNQAKVVSFK